MVALYRNEFVQGSDWNPIFPCCFVRLEKLETSVKAADGYSMKEIATFIIYVAARYNPAYDTESAIELTEYLYDELKDFSYENSSGNLAISQDSIKFVETNYGTDIYSIQMTVK